MDILLSASRGNMLTNMVSLLHRPFVGSQGVTRAESVIPAHVVIVAGAPCTTKLGKHWARFWIPAARSHPLDPPEGPQGPSGLLQNNSQTSPEHQSQNADFVSKRLDVS